MLLAFVLGHNITLRGSGYHTPNVPGSRCMFKFRGRLEEPQLATTYANYNRLQFGELMLQNDIPIRFNGLLH